ncbi:hypothetical protein P4S63_18835 [Pseudoalteromonas sp. B193]
MYIKKCSSIHDFDRHTPYQYSTNEVEWLNSIDFPTLITFPASVVGVRGEMKNQKEYKLPLTKAMRAIILEQIAWMENALPNCNPVHIFLQPRDLNKPFAKRSLDKIIKDYSLLMQ